MHGAGRGGQQNNNLFESATPEIFCSRKKRTLSLYFKCRERRGKEAAKTYVNLPYNGEL